MKIPQLLTLSALIGAALVSALPAMAGDPVNVINVTTTADGINIFDGACSLREAIQNANLNFQLSQNEGECEGGSADVTDVIVLVSGAEYSLTTPGNGDAEGDLDLFQDAPIALDVRITTTGESTASILQAVDGERVLENHGLTVEIDNILISGGSSGISPGGGIFNNGGNMTLTNVSVESNSAASGGGISNSGVLSLVNSIVLENSASLFGGGIFNAAGGFLSVSGSVIRGNSANSGGGISSAGDSVHVTGGTLFNSNTATNGNGGGILSSQNSVLVLNDAIFETNRAEGTDPSGHGGAVRHDSSGSLDVRNSSFFENQARLGGAIQVSTNSTPQIKGSSFTGNIATMDGGALHGTFLNVENSHFEANLAISFLLGEGGAIRALAVATVSDSLFLQNQAGAGGGVRAQAITLNNVEFRQNEAFSTGGAVSVNQDWVVDRSRFIANITGGSGGGLYAHDINASVGVASITRSLFTGNSAFEGGGVYIRANAEIGNTTIQNNSAGGGGGGLFIHGEGNVTAVNMTLAGNFVGGDLRKDGNLIMGNSVIFTPDQPDCVILPPAIQSLGNNIVEDVSCFGESMLPSDQLVAAPMLDPLADNGGGTLTMALQPGSPLIDAGSNDLCNASPVNGVDQRGAPRPVGLACDIGAHEQGAVAPSMDGIFKDSFEQD